MEIRVNPIGLTLVRVIKREAARILGQGLDFFDGTPILDLKRYRAKYRVDEFTLPEWFRKIADDKGYV